MKISLTRLLPVITSVNVACVLATSCPGLAPDPVPLYQLATEFVPEPVRDVDVGSVESIRNALALYPLAIDSKNFDALSNVFTDDAVANYSAPIGVLSGLPTIKSVLGTALAAFAGTQHQYGTQVIDVCSPDTAVSVTYFTATHFLVPGLAPNFANLSQVLYAYGQYQDALVRQKDCTWRIAHRNLVYMGELVSGISIS